MLPVTIFFSFHFVSLIKFPLLFKQLTLKGKGTGPFILLRYTGPGSRSLLQPKFFSFYRSYLKYRFKLSI